MQKTIQRLLLSTRIKAVLKLLQQRAGGPVLLDLHAAEHRIYLTSEPFLNKFRMLARPYEPGLNEEQVKLILENLGKVVAGQPTADQAELFGQVLQALEARRRDHPTDSGGGIRMAADIKARLADPHFTPEEKSALMEELPMLSDAKSLAQSSYKLYKLWRQLQNPAMQAGGKGAAAAASLGGKIMQGMVPSSPPGGSSPT